MFNNIIRVHVLPVTYSRNNSSEYLIKDLATRSFEQSTCSFEWGARRLEVNSQA